MTGQLDLLSPNLAPVVWRKLGAGTFFFIESRAPAGFTIRCLTHDGKEANPDRPTFLAGVEVAPIGEAFQVVFYSGQGLVVSPRYDCVDVAKEATEWYRHVGTFPTQE